MTGCGDSHPVILEFGRWRQEVQVIQRYRVSSRTTCDCEGLRSRLRGGEEEIDFSRVFSYCYVSSAIRGE